MDPCKLSAKVCHFGIAKTNMPESFLHWKDRLFLKNLWLQRPFRSYRIDLVTSRVIVRIRCGPLSIVPWSLSHAISEKPGSKSSLRWKDCLFFQKFVFTTTCWVLKKWSCNFHRNCQKTLWTLINCPLRLATLDNARKNTPKCFIYWKCCVFFKIFCFQQPLRCYRNDLVTSAANVIKPCGPL